MLHTRSELIQWVRNNVTDPVLQRAMEWGRIENLGGFRPLPTSRNPGWVVRITSSRGKSYNIAVGVRNFGLYWFRLPELLESDWESWIGKESGDELYRGDICGK